MAIIRNSRWILVAAVLLVALAVVWAARGSGSDSPVQAALAATQSLGSESSWSKFEGISDRKTNLGHRAWSDAFSVRLASKFVPPETRWSTGQRGGNVTLDATFEAQEIDVGTPSSMKVRSNDASSPDVRIQLASPSNQSDGKSIHIPMTATVVLAVPEDSDERAPAP